mmetsp:Transcript_7473/g.6616  ORF Transcript_7473/g.6616 Transcript_7473/m.6616 type:complete len:216 (+) Transcript_7473:1-648(+)
MALGQPFVVTAPPKIAGLWFSDGEQALATTLGSLAQPIGAVIGFLLPLPFISDDDGKSADGESKFLFYVLIQSIVITVLGAPIIFLIRNKPPTPPSASAVELESIKIQSQLKSIWALLKNPAFLAILGTFSCLFSVYITLGATVGQLTDQFGFGPRDNSIFGSVFATFGIIGSFIHAIPLDIYQKYRLQYIIIGFTSIVTCVGVRFGLNSGSFWI